MNKLTKIILEIILICIFALITIISFSLLFFNIEWIAGGRIVSTVLFSISLICVYLIYYRFKCMLIILNQ